MYNLSKFGQIWNFMDINDAFTPILSADEYWVPQEHSHLIREAYKTDYNSVFPPFVEQLWAYENGR